MMEKKIIDDSNDAMTGNSSQPVLRSEGRPFAWRFSPEHLRQAAFLAKSICDSNRLRILLCIRDGRKSVSAIVEELALSQPLVSHHLKELKRSLLVHVEREGPFIYYELSDARILDVVQTLTEVSTDLLSARKSF